MAHPTQLFKGDYAFIENVKSGNGALVYILKNDLHLQEITYLVVDCSDAECIGKDFTNEYSDFHGEYKVTIEQFAQLDFLNPVLKMEIEKPTEDDINEEPPCYCKDYHNHDAFCLYKKWNDKRKPKFE